MGTVVRASGRIRLLLDGCASYAVGWSDGRHRFLSLLDTVVRRVCERRSVRKTRRIWLGLQLSSVVSCATFVSCVTRSMTQPFTSDTTAGSGSSSSLVCDRSITPRAYPALTRRMNGVVCMLGSILSGSAVQAPWRHR